MPVSEKRYVRTRKIVSSYLYYARRAFHFFIECTIAVISLFLFEFVLGLTCVSPALYMAHSPVDTYIVLLVMESYCIWSQLEINTSDIVPRSFSYNASKASFLH